MASKKAQKAKREVYCPSQKHLSHILKKPKSVVSNWIHDVDLFAKYVENLFNPVIRPDFVQSLEEGGRPTQSPKLKATLDTMYDRQTDFEQAFFRRTSRQYDTEWEDIDWWAYCMWNIKQANVKVGIFSDRSYSETVIHDIIWKAMLHRIDSLKKAARDEVAAEKKKHMLQRAALGPVGGKANADQFQRGASGSETTDTGNLLRSHQILQERRSELRKHNDVPGDNDDVDLPVTSPARKRLSSSFTVTDRDGVKRPFQPTAEDDDSVMGEKEAQLPIEAEKPTDPGSRVEELFPHIFSEDPKGIEIDDVVVRNQEDGQIIHIEKARGKQYEYRPRGILDHWKCRQTRTTSEWKQKTGQMGSTLRHCSKSCVRLVRQKIQNSHTGNVDVSNKC